MTKCSILIVENNRREMAELVKLASAPDRQVVEAHDHQEAIEAIDQSRFDVVILDLRLLPGDIDLQGEEKGLDVLRTAVDKDPSTQVIVITNYANDISVVKAMKLGAYDYIDRSSITPDYKDVLPHQIRKALEYSALLVARGA
jgi:DNA-binding NtrC family response regulator